MKDNESLIKESHTAAHMRRRLWYVYFLVTVDQDTRVIQNVLSLV